LKERVGVGLKKSDSAHCDDALIHDKNFVGSIEFFSYELAAWESLKRIFFPLAGKSRRVTYEQK